MKIDYHPAIATELEEIRDCDDGQSAGLGRGFVNEFEKQILAIAAMLTRWMAVRNDVRRSLMKRFSSVIFFRITGAECIRITVVKQEKRHPALGLSRR